MRVDLAPITIVPSTGGWQDDGLRSLEVCVSRTVLYGLIAVASAQAATYYWDTNGGSAGAGDTPEGIWGSNSFWNTNSTGGTGSFITTSGTGDALNFVAGPAANSGENSYQVTVAGNQNGNNLVFASCGAATLPGTGTINLWGSSSGITVSQYGYGGP